MSIRTADVLEEHQIRLTGLPLRCSACFNQDPSRRHIDMDAACDRGYGSDEAVKVAYDDLVLCEVCVAEAARLIDYAPVADTQAEIESKDRKIALLEREVRQATTYSENLEKAFETRPVPVSIDHRKRPRQLRSVTDA